MKIYIVHSLTHAPPEFQTIMLEFKEYLKGKYEILEYYGLGPGVAGDIFKYDMDCVKNCDFILAEVSYPAIGVGFEIAEALHLGKKVLAIALENATVGRLVLGIDHPNYKFMRYKKPQDVLKYKFEDLW